MKIRFGQILLIFFALCVSLLYVRSRFMLVELSYRVSEAKKERDLLQQEQNLLAVELAVLKSPKRIQRIAKNKLNLSSRKSAPKVYMKSKGGVHAF